ncbi:hypothetical protein ACVME8_000561 [Bradyrhizobium diazoefficiens]
MQHGLGEHGQGRKLAGVQGARPGLPQQRAVVAEQGAGGRIGVDDLVGIGSTSSVASTEDSNAATRGSIASAVSSETSIGVVAITKSRN